MILPCYATKTHGSEFWCLIFATSTWGIFMRSAFCQTSELHQTYKVQSYVFRWSASSHLNEVNININIHIDIPDFPGIFTSHSTQGFSTLFHSSGYIWMPLVNKLVISTTTPRISLLKSRMEEQRHSIEEGLAASAMNAFQGRERGYICLADCEDCHVVRTMFLTRMFKHFLDC